MLVMILIRDTILLYDMATMSKSAENQQKIDGLSLKNCKIAICKWLAAEIRVTQYVFSFKMEHPIFFNNAAKILS